MRRVVYTCSICGTQDLSLPRIDSATPTMIRSGIDVFLGIEPPLPVYPLPPGWLLVPVADLYVDDELQCRGCVALRSRLETNLADFGVGQRPDARVRLRRTALAGLPFLPAGHLMKTTVYTCSICGTQEESLPLPEPPALAIYPLPRGWLLVPVADLEVPDDLHCRGCVSLRERLATNLAELEDDTDRVPACEMSNVEAMHHGCWVCHAETVDHERGHETIITLSCLLDDVPLNEAYKALCFAHRRAVDDVVKEMQAERGTRTGA